MITRRPLPAALILLGCCANSVTAVVTSDQPGSHLTTPGELAFDVSIGGVVLIAGDVPRSETIIDLIPLCTGALITDRHILSAAHCFDTDKDGDVDGVFSLPHVAVFELADRTVMMSINTGEDGSGPLSVRLLDLWPDVLAADLAVIELQEDAPAEIPRYPLYGGTNEVGRRFVLVGYGSAGYGATGFDESFDEKPTKRGGLNRYEAIHGDMPGVDYLAYDFDSGLQQNNALAMTGFDSDLGFGADEVFQGPGDSGSPNFINGVIAGVTSFRNQVRSADATDEADSSWGETGFNVRVEQFQDFIVDATGGTALFVPTGDFNHDGELNGWDIDLLSAKANDNVYEEEFD